MKKPIDAEQGRALDMPMPNGGTLENSSFDDIADAIGYFRLLSAWLERQEPADAANLSTFGGMADGLDRILAKWPDDER